MAKDNSVAPRERVNVTFTPNTGDVQQDVELPLKLVVLGDFTQRQDERSIEQRKPIAVDANSFDDVLAKQELSLAFTVPNRLQDEADNENDLPVQLDARIQRERIFTQPILGRHDKLALIDLKAALDQHCVQRTLCGKTPVDPEDLVRSR